MRTFYNIISPFINAVCKSLRWYLETAMICTVSMYVACWSPPVIKYIFNISHFTNMIMFL